MKVWEFKAYVRAEGHTEAEARKAADSMLDSAWRSADSELSVVLEESPGEEVEES
jgi:hypothetical protein